jgi:anti-sigma B factor antagonist
MAHLRPGQDTCPRRRWAQVPDHRYPLLTNGVPVVEAPEEIDICNAEQLRIVLLEAASRGHATIVVDMTRTRFCDSSGFSVLVAAHQRALAEGGGLRLVIPDGSRVLRIFTVIGLGRFIPRFASLDQALPAAPAAAAD